MNKKHYRLILLLFALIMGLAGLTACTQQSMARSFGGDITITLDPGIKLETITWRDDDSLWLLTRPMREGEVPETHTFIQDSSFGIFEGTVTIVETEGKDETEN